MEKVIKPLVHVLKRTVEVPHQFFSCEGVTSEPWKTYCMKILGKQICFCLPVD